MQTNNNTYTTYNQLMNMKYSILMTLLSVSQITYIFRGSDKYMNFKTLKPLLVYYLPYYFVLEIISKPELTCNLHNLCKHW